MKDTSVIFIVLFSLSPIMLLGQQHKGWSVGLEITPSFMEETIIQDGKPLFDGERFSLNGGISIIKSLNKNVFLEGKLLYFRQKRVYTEKYIGLYEYEEHIVRKRHFFKTPISINYTWKNFFAGIGISAKPLIERVYIVDGVKTDRSYPELVRPLVGNEIKIGYMYNLKEKFLIRTEAFIDYTVNQLTFDYGFSLGIFYNLNTKK